MRDTLQGVREQLRIVLLGPGESQPEDYNKRVQIRDNLREQGYLSSSLGEEEIGVNPLLPLPLALVDAIPNLDLVMVLDSGPAPLVELSFIAQRLEFRNKTHVWCSRDLLGDRRNTVGDLIKMFPWSAYDQQEFRDCSLTQEFVDCAKRFFVNKAQQEGLLSPLGFLPEPRSATT